MDSCYLFRQSKVLCLRITVHCCCVLGKIRAGWSSGLLHEDLGCITTHAQSAAATCSTGAVRSEDARLIMACWAFLWHFSERKRFFTLGGQEKYVLMPAKRSKPYQFFCLHLLPLENMDSCYVFRQSEVFCLHEAYHRVLLLRSEEDPRWVVLWTPA